MPFDKEKTIVIVGPTASGKSDLAIALARQHDGEIISADSRQVYRGMDIGTGKVSRDPLPTDLFYSEGIRHHLIDIADPNDEYNISHFLRDAHQAIEDIRSRGKRPILCGGTHFWIQALLDDTDLPAVPPDPVLREQLASHTPEELFLLLKTQDPKRSESIDPHNKIRLIRALEICTALGTVPVPNNNQPSTANEDSTIIAINPPKETLRERITLRLEHRLEEGMIDEVRRLHEEGISWDRLEAFGLEYRYISLFLRGKIGEAEMKEELLHAIWHYAKRQLSWLRRWERQGALIRWVSDPKETSVN